MMGQPRIAVAVSLILTAGQERAILKGTVEHLGRSVRAAGFSHYLMGRFQA
jgi:hypothetical protein